MLFAQQFYKFLNEDSQYGDYSTVSNSRSVAQTVLQDNTGAKLNCYNATDDCAIENPLNYRTVFK